MRKTCLVLGTVVLLAGTLWAQGSIVIYTNAKGPAGDGQGRADLLGDALEADIKNGLMDQYPCFDMTSTEDIKAALDYDRQRQLLGGADESVLANVAGSLGAQYIISLSVTVMDGQAYIKVSLQDATTGKVESMKDKSTENSEKAFSDAESLAKDFLQGLSNLKRKCDPHWSGSIIWEDREEAGNQKTEKQMGGRAASGQREEIVSTYTYTWNRDDLVEAVLMPLSLGSQGPNSPMAKLTRNFRNQDISSTKSSGMVFCRKPGSNPVLTGFSDEPGETYDAQGKNSWKHPVDISVSEDGSYQIEIRWEDVPYTWKRSKKEPGSGCPPQSSGEIITNGSDVQVGSAYTIRGKVDPKDPNTLAGRKVDPIDASALPAENGKGAITVTWNLRLVKPKSKK